MTGSRSSLRRIVEWRPSYLHTLVVIALVGTAVPLVAGRFYTFFAATILVAGLYAAAYDVLYGYTGLLSFGHAVFIGSGAYIATFAINDFGLGFLPALVLGFLASALLAAAIGVFAIRLESHGFVIVTILVVVIANLIVNTLVGITGGSDGLSVGLDTLAIPGLGTFRYADPFVSYYLALCVLLVSLFVLYRLVNSPVGLVFKMIRDDEHRARLLGYNTGAYKLAAFVVSGAFTGLAGVLDVAVTRFVSAEDVTIIVSADPLVHVIIGGRATLFGGLLGATVVRGVSDQFSELTDVYPLFVGVILILVVLTEPEGIIGGVRRAREWFDRDAATGEGEDGDD